MYNLPLLSVPETGMGPADRGRTQGCVTCMLNYVSQLQPPWSVWCFYNYLALIPLESEGNTWHLLLLLWDPSIARYFVIAVLDGLHPRTTSLLEAAM
ncbi:hypothetical protein XENTR_v10012592 [Xenopus tropicalis]|nr:hypothetical protein XENTR_v10012592 [Xenopus tropicalis]